MIGFNTRNRTYTVAYQEDQNHRESSVAHTFGSLQGRAWPWWLLVNATSTHLGHGNVINAFARRRHPTYTFR